MTIFTSILKIFKRISYIGVPQPYNSQNSRKVSLCNQTALIFFGVSFPYLFVFYSFDQFLLASSVIPFTFFFLLSILLNYFKKYLLAKFNLILTGNAALFFYSYAVGQEAGFHYIFFAIITTPLLLFESKETKAILFSSFISIILFFALHLFTFSAIPRLELPTTHITVINLTMSAITFTIIILSILFYFNANEKAEAKLIKTNKALEESYRSAKERKIMLEKSSQQTAFATLTRGIAHEIRNPMGMMLSSSELIMDHLDDKKKLSEYAEIIKKNILRLTKITTSMLRYGTDAKISRVTSNINDIIRDQSLVAEAEVKKRNITIKTSLTENLPEISIDPNAVSQALLNLILNSIEAIGQNGTITLRSRLDSFTPLDSKETMSGVKIEVIDNGCGISQDKIEQIFDPFYSSKYESNGLGLPMVLKTIQAHNGNIDIISPYKDKGTKVEVFLPIN